MPGFAAPETQVCYYRAEFLCHSLNNPLLLYSALMGQWRYSLSTDKPSVAFPTAKRIASLAQEQKDAALMLGGFRALSCTHYYLGDFDGARQYAIRGLRIWQAGDVKPHLQEIDPPAVACLCDKAQSEWHFGELACSRATMAEAVSLSKELNDIPGNSGGNIFRSSLSHYRRNHGEVERLASDSIELSTRQNFAQAINKLQKSSWDNTLRLPSVRLYAWGRSNYNV